MKNKNEKGGAVIEFALVLPIFLMLVFGIIEGSIAMYDKTMLTNASREGARAGVVLKNPRLTDAEITTIVNNYCVSRMISMRSTSNPDVSITRNTSGGTPVTSSGAPLTVTVRYNYQGLGLGTLLTRFSNPIQLSATTQMNYE